MTPNDFRILPIVIDALEKPREPRSILNYMCACDTANPESRKGLNNEDVVSPLLTIWFASGSELDDLCQPFAEVIRELKANPTTLVGNNWNSLDGKVAKVLLADQLSRSCFRGSAEAFSYDLIGFFCFCIRNLELNQVNDNGPILLYRNSMLRSHSSQYQFSEMIF